MEFIIADFLWIFMIYACLGWCIEVIYATVNTGKFINRGFLNGPYCPIYGFGMIAVMVCLTPLQGNIFLLFAGAVLLTTFIELITGVILEKAFNDKWWDYSDEHFNLKGYVCLKFSLLWGLGCVFVVQVVQPMILTMIEAIPSVMGLVLLLILYTLMAMDTLVTVMAVMDFKRRLHLLDEVVQRMKLFSNYFGDTVSDGVLTAMEKGGDLKETMNGIKVSIEESIEDKRQDLEKYRLEFEELKIKYESLLTKRDVFYERIIKAFPKLQEGRHKEFFENMRSSHKKNK